VLNVIIFLSLLFSLSDDGYYHIACKIDHSLLLHVFFISNFWCKYSCCVFGGHLFVLWVCLF